LKKVGIVGAYGFFGNALCNNANCFDLNIVKITKNNYSSACSDKYDFLINAATPSGKYWSLNNPYSDFQQTVDLTANLVYNWNYDKFIQISTMSANNIENYHPYGINKRVAEIITLFKKSLVVRLGSLYGNGMKKGPLYDLLNTHKLYVDIKSEYNYLSTDFCAKWIFNNLDKHGIVQLGAVDTISLLAISDKLGLDVTYEGKIEYIHSKDIEDGMPSTNEIWGFLHNYLKNNSLKKRI